MAQGRERTREDSAKYFRIIGEGSQVEGKTGRSDEEIFIYTPDGGPVQHHKSHPESLRREKRRGRQLYRERKWDGGEKQPKEAELTN